MNRNVKSFVVGGIVCLLFIFAFPLAIPPARADYYRNVTFLVPIAVALFFIPTASLTLRRWDIHIAQIGDEDRLRFVVWNMGETPFNFNRVAFTSDGKLLSPEAGLFGTAVELHGAETPSQVLHEHKGYTVKLGMPVTLWVRPQSLATDLARFKDRRRICLCIYFEGTDQIIRSKPLPAERVNRILSKP